MYSVTFIFVKKQFDEEFHKLDSMIAESAKKTTGYLGEESWENEETNRIANVYYWESMEGVQELMNNPQHIEAKAAQNKWLNGYQIVISNVVRAYGDGKLRHLTETHTIDHA